MQRFSIIYACCMLACSHVYAETSKPIQMDVTDGIAINVKIPDGWSHKKTAVPPGFPQTLRLANKSESTTLLLTFLPDPKDGLKDKDALENAIKVSTERYRRGSVEKTTKVISLKSDNAKGAYAVFTDASLAQAKKLTPGQFKQVVSGILVFDGCLATFTLLSDDASGDDAKLALKTLADNIKPEGERF